MTAALNERQKRFIAEYLIDLNATQAAVRAGYSQKTAYSMGQRLLKKVEIQDEIQKAMRQRQERTEINQDYVIEKLKEIAEMSASDMAISDLKYANKIRVLELLGKHLGMFDGKANEPEDNGKAMVIIDV